MADRYRIGSADDSPMQPSTIYWQDDSGELSWLCEERRISPVMLGQLLADANAGAAAREALGEGGTLSLDARGLLASLRATAQYATDNSLAVLDSIISDANAGAALRREPLPGHCECGRYEFVEGQWRHNFTHEPMGWGACRVCGTLCDEAGLGHPNPAYKPGE